MTHSPADLVDDAVTSVPISERNNLMIILPKHSPGPSAAQFVGGVTKFGQQPADVTCMTDMRGCRIPEPANTVTAVTPGSFAKGAGRVEIAFKPADFLPQLLGNPIRRIVMTCCGVGRRKKAALRARIGHPFTGDKADIHRSNPRLRRAFLASMEGIRGIAPSKLLSAGGFFGFAIWRPEKHGAPSDRLRFGCANSRACRQDSIVSCGQ